MKNQQALILTALSVMLFFCAAAQSNCQSKNKVPPADKSKNKNMKVVNPPDEIVSPTSDGAIKILTEGAYSKVETPFIFAARDPETYAQLQSLVDNLPPADAINFNQSAVVAAFAGTKNTGGYSVTIKLSSGKIAVAVADPPKDAMTTQALTMPYKIALVPLAKDSPLILELAENWQNAAQNYKVTASKFESSGGITGRGKEFEAEGSIKMLRFGDYATLIFDLSGKDTEKTRKLRATASGKLEDGKLNIMRLDAGSFAENPKPPLRVSGTAADRLNLDFEPLPTNVADGFQVRGKLAAIKIK